MFNGFFIKNEIRVQNQANMKKMIPELVKKIDSFHLTSAEKEIFKSSVFSEDAKTVMENGHADKVNPLKRCKKLIFNFFGMNDNWPLARNLLGGFMVHCPEYPTYFIPAYTQASATGEATDLKKGEGPRGIITGALEGIAVGALVSGERLRFREMGPYIVLGAGLQLFSSKVFSWAGEKVGQKVYEKRQVQAEKMAEEFFNIPPAPVVNVKATNKPADKNTFKGLYQRQCYTNNSGLKI